MHEAKSAFKTTKFKKLAVNEDPPESTAYFPWFTLCISAIDVLLLIYTIVEDKGFSSMLKNWIAGPSITTLIRSGAKFVPCMKSTNRHYLKYTVDCPPDLALSNKTCVYEEFLWYLCNGNILKGFPYQVYRLLICMFLHAGIIHLLLNLFSQLVLGITLERMYGSIRIAVIYILSGIGASLFSIISFPLHGKCHASTNKFNKIELYD